MFAVRVDCMRKIIYLLAVDIKFLAVCVSFEWWYGQQQLLALLHRHSCSLRSMAAMGAQQMSKVFNILSSHSFVWCLSSLCYHKLRILKYTCSYIRRPTTLLHRQKRRLCFRRQTFTARWTLGPMHRSHWIETGCKINFVFQFPWNNGQAGGATRQAPECVCVVPVSFVNTSRLCLNCLVWKPLISNNAIIVRICTLSEEMQVRWGASTCR